MENEGIQWTSQLLSKYKEESHFSISELLLFFFNVMTKYNETFSKMLSMLHYFDHSLCNQYFLTLVINRIWYFANEIGNILILFRGNIQNIEQHQSIAPNQ